MARRLASREGAITGKTKARRLASCELAGLFFLLVRPEGFEPRHTTATLLLEAGVSDSVRIAIMGHSNIAVTRGYEHISQTLARRALDDVAERLGLTA